jgi:regulator of protease activity HflC (stomatin/prohibitin superfamily)
MNKIMNKIMKKMIPLLLISAVAFMVSGCGTRVEVPPAHVGKIKTANGIEKDLQTPSSFRLPFSLMVKNQLIIVETSHFAAEEPMKIFMPKDKLLMTFDVRGTFSISPQDSGSIFDNITANNIDGTIMRIASDKVYAIYGKQVIRTKARAVVTKYGIYEVLDNMDAISLEIADACKEALKDTPLKIQRLGLADITPPEVIVKAQESAKEREVAIQEAEAQKMVDLKKAEAAKEVALKQQEVDLIEAETQVLVEKKLSESVSEAFVTQRALKALDKLVASDNTKFFLPFDAMTNPAIMIGAMNKAINEEKNK